MVGAIAPNDLCVIPRDSGAGPDGVEAGVDSPGGLAQASLTELAPPALATFLGQERRIAHTAALAGPDPSEPYRELTMALAGAGRLWEPGRNGTLQRITAGRARERLLAGLPVVLVTRKEAEVLQTSRRSSLAHRSDGLLGGTSRSSMESSSSARWLRVSFDQEPITTWEGLRWAGAGGAGFQHIPALPASGQEVRVQVRYEESFFETNSRSWGILDRRHRGSSLGHSTERSLTSL